MEASVKYLQIFGYNIPGINRDNMFPLICFPNRETELKFVRALISRPCRRLSDEPYFVINNPQLLPNDVRNPHMHDTVECDDDGEYVIKQYDNCYSVRDNMDLLMVQIIDNNTLLDSGFREAFHTLIR